MSAPGSIATGVYRPGRAAALAVLLTRWLVVAFDAGLVIWFLAIAGTPSNDGAAAAGVCAGAAVLLAVAVLTPRLRVELLNDPGRLDVVNLVRRHVIEADAIVSIEEIAVRRRWSLWSVGTPLYRCVYKGRRNVLKRLAITASIQSSNRARLTAMMAEWCLANGVAFAQPSAWVNRAPAPTAPVQPAPVPAAPGQVQGAVRLMPFDSPLATTTNTVISVVGVVMSTAIVVALAVSLVPGAPALPVAAFIVPFVVMFPLFLWAIVVLNTLSTRERLRRGVTRRPGFFESFGRGPLSDLPDGFLRTSDRVAMGVAFVVGFLCIIGTRKAGNDPPPRPFLGGSLVFTTAATITALAERRRRKGIHLGGILGWPRPQIPPPKLARSRGLIAWLLVCGATLVALGGGTSIVRSNDYQYHEATLSSHGTTVVSLPGGDDVIFVGNLPESGPAPFSPAQVKVIEVKTDARVTAFWDPSSDHNSPDAVPSLGLVSFRAPRDGRYRITVDGPKGLRLFVARSPGDEARLLAPWVVVLVLGLGIFVAGLVALLIRINWRYRVVRRQGAAPRTIEEWMAQGQQH
jgi:hypothetical protein